MDATRVFLFDRWLEIDPRNELVRIVPLRLPSIVTGVAMLSFPAALLMSVRSGERELTASGTALVVGFSLLALVFMVMPFARSNTLMELDLAKQVVRRRGLETPLSDAALRFVSRERRGEAFATLGGTEVRFLYLANDFTEIAHLVVLAAAAGMRGHSRVQLGALVDEAKRNEWKAYVAHLMLPALMLGAGAALYRFYVANGP